MKALLLIPPMVLMIGGFMIINKVNETVIDSAVKICETEPAGEAEVIEKDMSFDFRVECTHEESGEVIIINGGLFDYSISEEKLAVD
ncbi:hypothetical protein H0266_18390 [Halobacillus locisalis]|uniref:Uncharacterized protein n=1 Tax=Halobacillus locisalis TaxID=220753 RepID=A0A838CXH9_9BACI|nr:hypothetical protein [Halobacillus locisalis]MBA2176852.1 hypothetical protein [Halobacillus locisalis]